MVLPRVAGFILEIGDTATIPANDRAPRWKPPSTASRPPSGHPLPAHERAARLLARMSLLPTPERCWMARGWLARTRRTWFGWGALKSALGSGSGAGVNPCHTYLPVTKISARVRQNRTWAVEDRGPGP